jgi:hypothetical protein
MRLFVAALILALTPPPALAQEKTWLCVVEKVTGFGYLDGHWESIDFTFDTGFPARYLLQGNETKWVWKNWGKDTGQKCDFIHDPVVLEKGLLSLSALAKSESLHCDAPQGGRVTVNLLQKFFEVYQPGYWTGNTDDISIISIGTCAPL